MPKRIRARVVVRRPVDYRDTRGHGEGMLMDLSLQGCRIKGVPPFSSGTRLRLQLWLPDQFQPVKVEQAIVRWVKHDQCGVSFLEVQPEARARLERVFQLLREAQHPESRWCACDDERDENTAHDAFHEQDARRHHPSGGSE